MNNKKRILNGPYLLDPSASGITIVWESVSPGPMQVAYGIRTIGEKTCAAAYKKTSSCREYPDGCCLYTAELTGLQAGTVYQYAIDEQDTTLAQASFTTLQAAPEEISLVTLSDSHLFHTEKQFSRMIKRVRPDMILHGGDISFGTGYQHEQYEENWFQKIPAILQQVPVYYIPGNHDDGPFFVSYFTEPQARNVHSMKDGSAFSFEYGAVHVVMADSNPWGLFEMNAVNSGFAVDDETQQRIDDTLRWIEADLSSPAAQQAPWRILIVHHPYTDTFNNKYIVPIAEKNHVNLVLGGHLHYYVKTASINPAIGAKLIYVSQGSTQEPEVAIHKIDEGKRLLGDFPEVTAMGRSNYGLLKITAQEINYELYGFTEDGDDVLVDTIHMTHDASTIELDEIELRRMDNNGHVEIQALARNTGNAPAVVTLDVYDNQKKHVVNLFGIGSNSYVVYLEAGESAKIVTIYKAITQGNHTISVQDSKLDIVVFEPEQLSFQYMKIFAGKGEASDCMSASIEATNNLDRELFLPVPLYINQRIAESKNLFFRGHEKKSIEFHYKFPQGGNYQVSIADQLPKEIHIEEGIRIIPRIHDKSGHGHTGLLHGTPKVIPHGDTVEVCFEQYGDYIEIPASEDFNVTNSFTSMVWANVERLAKANEMGHNPFMVRGKSVGWGATYLLRMVVERAGGLKWGTCYDITEYSWQGGHVELGQWVQYSMAFDKKRGGDSWCNGQNVAHVPGIEEACHIRDWENEPIFIGYSYIGHVIPEIDRPKYFTHLPGRVSQARFYKTALTEEENQHICDAPAQKGPKGNKLTVWFDFHDILNVGTHTTEWRYPAVYAPGFATEKKYWRFRQLKVKTVLPLQAGLKATVEVSDDGVTVKERMHITLKDGTGYIDLSSLPPAQYIRIMTEFVAEVGAEGTFIPELKEYQVTAFNETDFTEMYWSTRKDWERGTFTGAVGFAPVDRLREYPEYTDVIHG
ncbi:MAG: metallophosphoesterase [Megasphaera sp.]|jgi:predicted MPP superfamily phosphohydrolase|nr:metallophosphoesterase [Megasphaera sp.]MCI1248382.1 metallophosphoesterase [Megasphaera sp.]